VQDRQVPLDVFVGRAAELARAAEVVTRVEAGQPWLVAIEGDPGIGKTALARRCLAQAPGLQVLSARAGQAETDLDFGIIDQLLRAARGVSPSLLPASGIGPAVSSFAVGARLLEVVGEQQAQPAVAIMIDDLQWADRRSVEALTFMLRRLSVDPVVAVVTYRGPSDRLDDAAQRMLLSIENRLRIQLGGLDPDDVAALAAALTAAPLDGEAVQRLYEGTGGHALYLRTLLSEGFDFNPRAAGRLALPRSLAAAIGEHLRVLPPETRVILEMLSVLNLRLPLTQLGQAAEVDSPSTAIEPAVASGLVDWWPEEPTCPVAIRHLLVRDAVYAGITPTKRRLLAAMIANRLAGTYTLLGEGEKTQYFARWALGTGCLDAAAASQTRTLVAIGASQVVGPREALAELGHIDADPARADLFDVDGLTFRGWFHLLAGDLDLAVRDLAASVKMARRGATLTLGVRAYFYLALAQYLVGEWDDELLSAEQGFSAAVIHSRRYELPLLHLAAGCVPAGRGASEEAERHARLAEEAAASLDYGQEKLYAAMARALVCQGSGDYLGMADALEPWRDAVLDGRSRLYARLWRPLLAEGLVGSGQAEQAAAVLDQLRADSDQVTYLQPAQAWLDGWLAELRGAPQEAGRIYQRGEDTVGIKSPVYAQSPVYTARLLLAHGRLLRRTGQRRLAVERLRRANDIYLALRAAPFVVRTEEELAACHLPADPARKQQPVLALTSRETEVAHLVGKGMSNPEIAAELFISRKAVEYHLGNIYAKCGLQGRQELRRFVGQWRQPAAV
jgi:DNA-binding CsgD family transcriptional regulator